ncbi:hypothetical protein SAMN04487857_12219 [Pseudomonas sp. ok272]|uniref:DUF6392 family protein n=1 Tax=unclassified Pseudomonas TaxID=196821 RepID=UPI0008C2ECCC|nr:MULTISPECIES: DUF6392 family protein [unclassified Pseudomonas]SEN55745.1 hypothetical protein SAMN04487857_12219 [Pseudomonas sp. ok272]SFN41676.1 hypothetical protein SAMN04487858_1278 [Pseudomonas sp. ok602]
MNAETIERWVENLGRRYGELVAEGIIPDQPLVKPFQDSNWPTLHPGAGLELVFREDSKRLERVMIILIPTADQPVYIGQLPAPFTLNMNQSAVRQVLGAPETSKRSGKLPGGLGMRGGSDTYYLDQQVNPNVKVTLAYLEDRVVNNISFALIVTGHD